MNKDALLNELKQQGISDKHVLEAMAKVPREHFIGDFSYGHAYDNTALPIACGQTISQPYIVALMTQAVLAHQPKKVLEVGTGSGYQAAILSLLADQVISIERIDSLYQAAKQRLAQLKYDNVQCLHGDGYEGCKDYAPYDGIVVTAASQQIPTALLHQLAEGGRLIIPIGATGSTQTLMQVTKQGDQYTEQALESVVFVPMLRGSSYD